MPKLSERDYERYYAPLAHQIREMAWLEVTRHPIRDWRGNVFNRNTYRWIGARHQPVAMDLLGIRRGMFDDLPWSLEPFAAGEWGFKIYFLRTDYSPFWRWFNAVEAWSCGVAWQVGMRLILTLSIWGVARYPNPGERIGWQLFKGRRHG